jgi:single-strand DNA-binding protein
MTDTITITGLVATTPRHLVTSEGLPITSFRVASTQRRFDRSNQKWIDGDTNWYSITLFRQLATNAAGSVNKGDRVIITGRLKIREWQNSERGGLNIDIEADALGHDLSWGTAIFSRVITGSGATAAAAPSLAPDAEPTEPESVQSEGLDREGSEYPAPEVEPALPF